MLDFADFQAIPRPVSMSGLRFFRAAVLGAGTIPPNAAPVFRSGNHLESNRFITDVLKALTPRLGDSQSNLKPIAASALAEVASSLVPDAAAKVSCLKACRQAYGT